MGRVGVTATTCTHRCRLFWFWFCFIVAFPCCLHPSMMMFVSFGNFWEGRKRGVFYIPLSSLKLVDSVYTGQHSVALVLGATQATTKIS